MALDLVLLTAAAVITAAVIVLAALLASYTRLVREADRSSRLAKDVWDSMNSRLSVMDSRLIDVMAKTEVLSARMGLSRPAPTPPIQQRVAPAQERPAKAVEQGRAPMAVSASSPAQDGTETELKVLRLLASGPLTSAQIKDELGRSREHTARLMKTLFDRGLVVRNDRNKPYVYEITQEGRSYVAS